MGKQPSFQFYPGDWLKDPNLSRCTLAAQGAAIRLLCYMHESNPRGVLPWTDDEIVRVLGAGGAGPLAELLRKGVFDRDASGSVCSRRLVRESALSETRRHAGRVGGHRTQANLALLKQNPKQTPVGGVRGGSAEAEKEVEEKKRVPNQIWDSVCEVFGFKPVTKTEQRRVGRIVRDLKLKGATPDDIQGRTANYRIRWPAMSCTPEAVLKHWDSLERADTGSSRVRAAPGKYDRVRTTKVLPSRDSDMGGRGR